MKKKAVISLCDYTGLMFADWVEEGYEVFIVDPQHGETRKEDGFVKIAGTIIDAGKLLSQVLSNYDVRLVAGFPPCTDVAVSGSKHFESKTKSDALVWAKAVMVAEQCRMVGVLAGCPWFFENPVSVFANDELFGKACFYFDPCDYGGYLDENDRHPLYPEYINDRDAYTKKTCLWTGGGFEMPEMKPVPVPLLEAGSSKQYSQLGGKSLKTKNIRSATPRGFARAVFLKYCVDSAKEKA